MIKFTLDTNCIIAVEEQQAGANSIRELANAHTSGGAKVAVIAMSASERQRGKKYLDDYDGFRKRLSKSDLSHLDIIYPMCYIGISAWGFCLLTDEDMSALEIKIHRLLFPNMEFRYEDFCAAKGLVPNAQFLGQSGDWRNAKCDVQAIWSHIHAKQNVFVTTDRNFHKPSRKSALLALGAGQIETPDRAAALLH